MFLVNYFTRYIVCVVLLIYNKKRISMIFGSVGKYFIIKICISKDIVFLYTMKL